MKFSSYTQAVQPNTINAQVHAVTDPHAYGTGGKEWDALTGAIGQANKVAAQIQEQNDTSDIMEARNRIMTSLTENLYGEQGLFTTGVGENAKGLTGRTTDLIRKTFSDTAKDYNGRVQRALQGNLNENMANFQRIAASQEQHEYRQALQNNFTNAVTQNNQLAALNYAVNGFATGRIHDNEKLLQAYGQTQGWNGSTYQAEHRKMVTDLIGSVAKAAIGAGDYDRADSVLTFWRKDMDQGEFNQIYATVRKHKQSAAENDDVKNIFAKYRKADGSPDMDAIRKAIHEHSLVNRPGGVASYSGDNGIDDAIRQAANKYGIDPSLLAAVGSAESGFNQGAVSNQGAIGIMQLMPGTAQGLGVDPNDANQNIEGGAKYLRQLLDQFGGDEAKAVAAYNAGPQAVIDAGGVPDYKETQAYVAKVHDLRAGYQSSAGGNAAGVEPYYMGAQSGIDEQVQHLQGKWQDGVLGTIGGVLKNKFGVDGTISSAARSPEHNASIPGASPTSHHIDHGDGGDAVDIVLPDNADADAIKQYFENSGAFDEVLFHDAGTGLHLHLGGYKGSWGNGSGGNGSYYDTEKEQRELQLADAMMKDWQAQKKAQEANFTDSIVQLVKDAPDRATATNYLLQYRGQLTPGGYSTVMRAISMYHPAPASSTGGGGSSHSGGRTTGGYNPAKDQAIVDKYNYFRDNGYNISGSMQHSANQATERLQANGYMGSGDNLASGEALNMAMHAVEVTANDEEARWYLESKYDYSEGEADYYVKQAHRERGDTGADEPDDE